MSVPFPNTNAIFHDEAIYAAEQAEVFERGWVFVGETQPAPGNPRLVERIGRFLFACPGGDPPCSLDDYLGPMASVVQGMSDAAARPLFEVRMEIAGNWKLVVSGAIEEYHLPFVHGQSVNPWRTESAVPTYAPFGHSSYRSPAKVGLGLRALLRVLAGAGAEREEFENLLIYPNLLLIRLWGLTHVTVFTPQGPGRTLRVTRIYGRATQRLLLDPRRWARSAAAAAFEQGVRMTFREDKRIVEEAQRGTLAGRRMRRGPAHAEEARVEAFLAETARRLRGTSASAR